MLVTASLVLLALPHKGTRGALPYGAAQADVRPDARRVDRRPEIKQRLGGVSVGSSLATLLPNQSRFALFSARLGGKLPKAFREGGTKKPDVNEPNYTRFLLKSEVPFRISEYSLDRHNVVAEMADFAIDSRAKSKIRIEREISELRKRLGEPSKAGPESRGEYSLSWRWADGTYLYYRFGPAEDKEGAVYVLLNRKAKRSN